jgi:hypothetical protein
VRHGREVLGGIERQLGEKAHVRGEGAVGHEQRVAVRGGLGYRFRGNVARRAGLVLHDDRLVEDFLQVPAEQAGNGVRAGAGRERHDDSYRLVRVRLRVDDPNGCNDRDHCRDELHFFPPR